MAKILILLLTALMFTSCSKKTNLTDSEKLDRFFQKKSVKVVITDSGLGGLSVFADLVERISGAGVFDKIQITYFNAQPHITSGYNSMKTNEQKVQVFDNALQAMQDNFEPDLILIACNTLSVLYPVTKFSQESDIPVVGIVGTGVDLIQDRLQNNDSSKVIIFATLTTVEQNSHKKMLVAGGVPEDRILTQACPELAGEIERGAGSEKTKNLVRQYVDQALEKLPDQDESIIVSFNCTHYGYVGNVFADCLRDRKQPFDEILDPNSQMIDFMFTEPYLNRYSKTEVSFKVVSQPELSEDRITSIGSLIAKTSPASYEALKNYTFTPELFEWRSIAENETK